MEEARASLGRGRDQLESSRFKPSWGPRGHDYCFQPGPGGGDSLAASSHPQGLWGAQGAGSPSPLGEVVFPWESSLAWSLAAPSSPKGNKAQGRLRVSGQGLAQAPAAHTGVLGATKRGALGATKQSLVLPLFW